MHRSQLNAPLASFLAAVLEKLILLVKIYLNIFYLWFTNCGFMETSCLNNEDFLGKFRNGPMSRVQDISGSKIIDLANFNQET
jgi:hypothetical protein